MTLSTDVSDSPKQEGRPTKYKPEYAEQFRKLCLLGATDVQVADFFGVCEATIYNWKKEHPEFLEAEKESKYLADAKVAESLFKRACGYSHPDTHISNYQGEITKTEIVKHYPPDATSCIFWLKNRQKEKWRDKQEVGGDPENPIVHNHTHMGSWDDIEAAQEKLKQQSKQ